MTHAKRPFRVLSIDGGGMRGLYAASYLSSLEKQYAATRKAAALDIGKGFDLVTGTSTGGIIACGLAAGIPVDNIAKLYRDYGGRVFPAKLPSRMGMALLRQMGSRPKLNRRGAEALRSVLNDHFGDETVDQVYKRRGIALSIPAVEMTRHRSWVFRTSHLGGRRDNNFSLVDVCMATSAAPIYRSLVDIRDPKTNHRFVFADGGLWANNPVLVGLTDALDAAPAGADIEIFLLGTNARPTGRFIKSGDVDWGFGEWRFGGEMAMLSVDAQQYAYDNMARMLLPHLKTSCTIIRFPHDAAAAAAMRYLDLDETSSSAIRALEAQARSDVSHTLGIMRKKATKDAVTLDALFMELPVLAGRVRGD